MDTVLTNGQTDHLVRFSQFAGLALDAIDQQMDRLERGIDPELGRTLLRFAREVDALANEPANAPADRLAPRAAETVSRIVYYLSAVAAEERRG